MVELIWQHLFCNLPIISVMVVVLVLFKARLDKKKAEKEIKRTQDKFRKLLSQKKSSEVRVGKIGENMAPFMKDWPYDPNRFRFLGNPVDGIQFTDDEVIFVEIKTGKSKLTKTQRSIRNLLRKKDVVSFATFRVGENGCTLKRDGEDEEDEEEV